MATGPNQISRRRLGRIPVTSAVSKQTLCSKSHPTKANTNGGGNQAKRAPPPIPSSDIMESFSSSFCTDLDVEMLDAIDKIENNFNTKKPVTPKARKCQLQMQTTKSPVAARKSAHLPTNSGSGKSLLDKQSLPHTAVGIGSNLKSSNKDNLSNMRDSGNNLRSFNSSKDKIVSKSRLTKNFRSASDTNEPLQPSEKVIKKNILQAQQQSPCVSRTTSDSITVKTQDIDVFKSPGIIQGHGSSRTIQHLSNNENITWQTPKVASTPAGPHFRGHQGIQTTSKKQSQLFKSLFTLQNSMNISDIILSPCVDKGTDGKNKPFDSKPNTPLKVKDSNLQKKKIFNEISEKTKDASSNRTDKDNDKEKHVVMDNGFKEKKNTSKRASFLEKSSLLNVSADKLNLASWGLPEPVLNQYKSKGITSMFEWQAECLCTGNTLAGGNLVYSAPTSAGKTMVAELLVLKRVMETKKKAIFILPFVSVAREKMYYLQQLYQDAGIRVSGFMGSHSPPGGLKSVDVAVCTIEKGNGLINRLMEHKEMDKLGIIVVDELHLVGDSHRGYLLELMLTKICYVVRKEQEQANKENQHEVNNSVQIIGMSATLPNLDLLARWLKAELYHTDFRPVPLTESVKFGNTLYDNSMVKIRDIDLTLTFKDDPDHVIPLCLETVKAGNGVLVFCPTKNWCEKLSEAIAKEFYMILRNSRPQNGEPEELPLPLNGQSLMDIVEQLKRTPVGLDITLGRTVPFGVAYHHAGLTFDERDIVEGSFRQGILKVLIATSTLSSGVNLPARRVIVRTPTVYAGKTIDILTYKQMIGRAGRKGVDTEGESILMCKPNERDKAVSLLSSTLPPVQSCLVSNEGEELSSSLKRAILEIVVSGVASVPADVALYTSCTMLSAAISADDNTNQSMIAACLKFLQENEFVCLQKVMSAEGVEEERFCPTQLGSAVLASSLSPREGLVVFAELQKARQCFVLENELHIIYLVTPIYSLDIGSNLDWYQFYCLWENLSVDMKRVAELVGVQESFIAKAIRGRILTKTEAQMRSLAIHRRFYTSLILHDLVHEMPLPEVARKYNCNKGQLQSLQQSAATFAGMVTVFCARLGWHNLELILGQFQNRLTFGIQRELCDLVRLDSLNGQRARVLYNAGYHTVTALANATNTDVEIVLKNAAPFQSKKQQENETEYEAAQRQSSRCIWLTGRKGVTELEAADAIIAEAKSLIQEELGGLGIQWKSEQDSVNKTQNESAERSSVLVTPNVSNPQRRKSNSSFKRGRNSTGKRRSFVKKRHSKSINSSTGTVFNDSQGQIVVNPPSLNKSQGRSFVNPPVLDLSQNETTKEQREQPKTGSEERLNIEKNAISEIQKKETGRPCQIVPKYCQFKNRSKNDNIVEVQAEVHHREIQSENKVESNEKMEVDCNHGNITNDLELSQISFSIGKEMKNDKNTEKVIESSDNGNRCLLNNDDGVELLQVRKNDMDNGYINNKHKGDNTVKRSADGQSNGVQEDAELHQAIAESEDLFAGLTQEFEVSCQAIDERQTLIENPIQKNSELVEKPTHLEIGEPEVILETNTEKCSSYHNANHKGQMTNDSEVEKVKAFPVEQQKENLEACAILDDDFADSFCLDTQVAMDLSSKPHNKSENVIIIDDDVVQASSSKTRTKRVIDRTLNKLSIKRPSVKPCQNAENGLSSSDVIVISPVSKPPTRRQIPQSENVEPIIHTKSPDIIPNREKSLKGNNSPQVVFDKAGDLLDESADLIAASNFERCMYVNSEDIFSQSGQVPQNDSYQDLHIPFQSGQERIFEENERVQQRGITPYKNLHEDLAVAMEMGDTFMSTFQGQVDSKTPNRGQIHNEFDDSLTFSMVENVLNEEPKNPARSGTEGAKQGGVDVPPGSKNSKENLTVTKAKKNKLSPGTLAFLDSVQSFSFADTVIHIDQNKDAINDVNSNQMEGTSETNKDIVKDCHNRKELAETENRNGKNVKSKAQSIEIKRIQSKPGSGNDTCMNNGGENDLLPPTPPDNTYQSPLNSRKRKTPSKLKLTPSRLKLGSESIAIESKGTATKRLKMGEDKSNFERIKDQISQLEDVDDDAQNLIGKEMEVDYTERTFDFEPDQSSISATQGSMSIIDVCASSKLFDTFRKEWSTKLKYAVSLACERKKPDLPAGGGIGGKFLKGKGQGMSSSGSNKNEGILVDGTDLYIVGLAVCWENKDSYYISLKDEDGSGYSDESLIPAASDDSITTEVKLKVIQTVIERPSYRGKSKTVTIFDSKSFYTLLVRGCGIITSGKIQDPKIAYWMLDPGAKEKSLHGMVHNYLPTEGGLLDGIGGGIGYTSLGLTPENPGTGRYRATAEAVLSFHVMDYFCGVLQKEELLDTFQNVEMPALITLARMELNGFGYSENECESQMNIMLARLSSLEEQAYQLAGHPFSLTATEDIAQVLFIELQLPPDGDPSKIGQLRGSTRAVGQRKGRGRGTLSTSKEVLEKLRPLHPLPDIILEWRRISSALTKVVFQLQKVKVHNTRADMYRIFCETQFHTATGRVSMTEPNLQNIPKDFDINLPDVIGESPSPDKTPLTNRKGKGRLNQMKSASKPTARVENTKHKSLYSVSMRHAFVPFKGGILVAADYSQLELRMIAHLSHDRKLIKILNEDGDVFKLITAEWKGITPEEVTAVQRQQAKQVCYGMIYGIGAKALGQQLEVDENDAAVFIETFKAKYPSMRSYLRTTVEFCREKGYVQTISGRRRYLPSITSTQPYSRAHAERQAVNTTVQGSAADLVKNAMNKIDAKLTEVFPSSVYTHSHKFIGTRNTRSRSKSSPTRLSGGYLVLQLHDELIYEVCQDDLVSVAEIIQKEMENAMKLSVRLPVKVKTGPSWGKLEEMSL